MAEHKISRPYLPALDALRAVAILMVVIHHASYRLSQSELDPVAQFVASIGWAGVDLFFAISGYLITSILTKSAGSLRAFFVKRVFRIVPLYWVAISTYGLFATLLAYEDISGLWMAALFLTGWVVPFAGSHNVPYLITWSLSVEEAAYLFFGVMTLLCRSGFTKVLWLLIFSGLILRWWLVTNGVFQAQDVYYFPPTRIDAIALGGLVAVYRVRLPITATNSTVLVLFTAAVLVWLSRSGQADPHVAIFGYTAFSLVAAAWVALLVSIPVLRSRSAHFLAYVGRRSYFLYLFHVFVLAFFELAAVQAITFQIGFWGNVILIFVATLLLSEISWRFFESPMIELGRRLAARY